MHLYSIQIYFFYFICMCDQIWQPYGLSTIFYKIKTYFGILKEFGFEEIHSTILKCYMQILSLILELDFKVISKSSKFFQQEVLAKLWKAYKLIFFIIEVVFCVFFQYWFHLYVKNSIAPYLHSISLDIRCFFEKSSDVRRWIIGPSLGF